MKRVPSTGTCLSGTPAAELISGTCSVMRVPSMGTCLSGTRAKESISVPCSKERVPSKVRNRRALMIAA